MEKRSNNNHALCSEITCPTSHDEYYNVIGSCHFSLLNIVDFISLRGNSCSIGYMACSMFIIHKEK